ncbi:MAG TPA: helicase-related protein [Ktedonobacteraceae bacterium]|jgi:superfamily II DNA or RNA helicase
MNFAVGSLVRARGREWVVLPESDELMLILRPLGGTNEEVAGIYLPLEQVEPARFALPDPARWGDERSCRLLRDAVRLGFRSSAGPFRSFARLAVDPRPYQLVPLLLALRLDPVRLLIADDVGIGKTIEAGLIARELLDRREIERLAVLCPPHLAEQWQEELLEKFHIEAVTVLSGTAALLERACQRDESIFAHYPYLIISIDFIKSDRRRDQFLQFCPELVIVDEAHACAYPGEGRGARHQRYQLVEQVAAQPDRHLILVTATPHSGNEQAFRSLLTFLDQDFRDLPQDVSGKQHERQRQRLAAHFVQRKRSDLRDYLHQQTPFPARVQREEHYTLNAAYRTLIDRAISYARETVSDASGGRCRLRVRWWSVLALLRSMASSPAAAAFTLRNRAQVAGAESAEEADRIGRHTILDLIDSDATEGLDVAPGSDFAAEYAPEESALRNRLAEMARDAADLQGAKDAKLQKMLPLIGGLVKEGYRPIVFCRFIPTAEYVMQELRTYLPRQVEVVAVTGLLPPAEREERVHQLAQARQRVLVCTDCLSEGINLQDYFDAVFHYDLSWNPTRHEQREGRVDRFGQQSPRVMVVTYYGQDNIIDDLVLKVLIRKHQTIRNSLGVSVPIPLDSEQVVEALFEGVLAHDASVDPQASQPALPGFNTVVTARRDELFRQWDASSERERRSRTLFAQQSIKTTEVEKELRAVQESIGQADDVASFTREALQRYGGFVSEAGAGLCDFNLREIPLALKDALDLWRFAPGNEEHLRVSFTHSGHGDGRLSLGRTHPLVEGLAAYLMDTALDSQEDARNQPIARRCGLIKTSKVETRTTLLLVRLRFHIHTPARSGGLQPLLAEDCRVFAFRGVPRQAEWFDDEHEIAELLQASSEANTPGVQIKHFLQQVIDGYPDALAPHLEHLARERAEALREAHRRVRKAASISVRVTVEPQLPPDILGMYVYLPYQG